MARRRADTTPGTRDGVVDEVFGGVLVDARGKLGGKISVGDEAVASLVGLPLPALCLRYFLQSTIYALTRIAQITGEEGSAKSALAYEIMRWHAVYGGGSVLFENEGKDAADLRCAIWQWNQRWLHRCHSLPTYSLEGWQDGLTQFVTLWRDRLDAPGGIGYTVPICFTIDSIMGTAPQCEIDEVNKTGHAERGWAVAANLITRYMRTMPDRLADYPFSIVGTNHQKPAMTPQGFPTSNIPGGKSVKFHETLEIEMSKTMNKDIDKLEYGGLRVKLVCKKNAGSPSRRMITAELLWWYEDDGVGGFRQQAAWDWDTASIELLLSFATIPGKATIARRLQEICDIHVANKGNRTAYSAALGVPASDPQPYRYLGALLERRDDLLMPIYRTLGILVRRPFQPGVDYREACAVAAQEAAATTQATHAGQAVPVISPDDPTNADNVVDEPQAQDADNA